jgi:hypothetical protein
VCEGEVLLCTLLRNTSLHYKSLFGVTFPATGRKGYTKYIASGNELGPLLQKANLELRKIATWFCTNKMAVNASKTKYFIFKPQGTKINLNSDKGVYFDNNDDTLNPDPSKITKLDRVHIQ